MEKYCVEKTTSSKKTLNICTFFHRQYSVQSVIKWFKWFCSHVDLNSLAIQEKRKTSNWINPSLDLYSLSFIAINFIQFSAVFHFIRDKRKVLSWFETRCSGSSKWFWWNRWITFQGKSFYKLFLFLSATNKGQINMIQERLQTRTQIVTWSEATSTRMYLSQITKNVEI